MKLPDRIRRARAWLAPIALFAVVAFVVLACAQGGQTGANATPAGSAAAVASAGALGVSPGASAGALASPQGSAGPSHTATPIPTPLVPASPGADPISLMAFLFTPVFQALFIVLAMLYVVLAHNIVLAIIGLTLIIRVLTIPLFRQQTVSQRRMQLIQPEIKEIQRRYKGDRAKVQEATMALYKERGVNPAAGCLPLVLQFILLIPMYSVIRDGLTNYDPTAMLSILGNKIVPLTCPNPSHIVNGVLDKAKPCIDTVFLGYDLSHPEISIPLPILGGLSILALFAGLLQLVQSRMVMPAASSGGQDQSSAIQRQTMVIFPLMSVVYGSFLPAGLFIYWIVTTIFSVVQQYLIVGFGSLFPLFGWTPAFALNHQPRFPVPHPEPIVPKGQSGGPPRPSSTSRAASAAATVRAKERGRQGRRGRRR